MFLRRSALYITDSYQRKKFIEMPFLTLKRNV
ncbi:hypothetical protein RUMTOR_01338 [[Ruminococcus] torques ATCC 27756]|uniref:Uncharacterized protein n=1 Tax=[Ruminococcus] torques ATCC 27756 TaxID=411460 RepID=A5KM75_9FIRM|nr:hypothetical protein RUMTOR_01338 [[Ruminococcus] torques ATCC 27756]